MHPFHPVFTQHLPCVSPFGLLSMNMSLYLFSPLYKDTSPTGTDSTLMTSSYLVYFYKKRDFQTKSRSEVLGVTTSTLIAGRTQFNPDQMMLMLLVQGPHLEEHCFSTSSKSVETISFLPAPSALSIACGLAHSRLLITASQMNSYPSMR